MEDLLFDDTETINYIWERLEDSEKKCINKSLIQDILDYILDFYEEKGLKPPVRCKECKAKRKEQQAEQSNNIVQEKSTEKKQNDFEAMLERFKANTILFEEEREKRNKKRK